MGVEVRLAAVMGERKMRSISELSRKSGIARSTLTTLWYGTAKGITFETLGALCKALNCKPGDLLVYVPDEEGGAAK